MGALDGRVAIVTGAGRGVGREEALLLAAEGAAVVVNDLGGATDGTGRDAGPAEAVVEEIRAAGGQAVANGADVSDWDAATAMVEQAVGEFGRLDVLVNNAGILRDRSIVNVEPAEWELVQAVHLRGHAATTRAAGAYWRQQAKAGEPVAASIVNTTSVSGLFGNFGQTNYGSAKAGHRRADGHHADRTWRLRRTVQRHCPLCPHPTVGRGRGRGHAAVRPARAGQHRAVRRLPGYRAVPDRRQDLLCPRRPGAARPAVHARRVDHQGRPVDGGRAGHGRVRCSPTSTRRRRCRWPTPSSGHNRPPDTTAPDSTAPEHHGLGPALRTPDA